MRFVVLVISIFVIEKHFGIQFSGNELILLVTTGAYAIFCDLF